MSPTQILKDIFNAKLLVSIFESFCVSKGFKLFV